MAKIFYKEEEIRLIKFKQQKDQFEEIVELKKEATDDANRHFSNKIDINYFAPKAVITTGLNKLKSTKFSKKWKSLLHEDEGNQEASFILHGSYDQANVAPTDPLFEMEKVKLFEVQLLNEEINNMINQKLEKATHFSQEARSRDSTNSKHRDSKIKVKHQNSEKINLNNKMFEGLKKNIARDSSQN